MNRINIPKDLFDDFKCGRCKKYLSCGPVYLIDKTEETICGRCDIVFSNQTKYEGNNVRDKEKRIRCTTYETSASLLLFPCIYEEYGCEKKLHFKSNGIQGHESKCEYEPHSCPLDLSRQCKWFGPWNLSLVKHADNEHNIKVLKNPCTLVHDIKKSIINLYLISDFNFLFLLQVRVFGSTNQIYYSIRILGDDSYANNFAFDVDVEQNDTKFSKTGQIYSLNYSSQTESSAVVFDINKIKNTLNGFDDVHQFKIILRELIAKKPCRFCRNVTYENKLMNQICTECTLNLYTCENRSKGCQFVDINKFKYHKHKVYFCSYLKTCQLCSKNIKRGLPIVEHYKSDLHNRKYKTGEWFEISSAKNDGIFLIQNNYVSMFFVHYTHKNDVLNINLLTPFSSDEFDKYTFTLESKQLKSFGGGRGGGGRGGFTTTASIHIHHFQISYGSYDWSLQLKSKSQYQMFKINLKKN